MSSPTAVNATPIPIIKIENSVPAGFPVSHTDCISSRIDLNNELLIHSNASYLFRVRGNSMIGVGIFDGDTLIVDRSIQAQHGNIVLAILNREFTVKRLQIKQDQIALIAENPEFEPIQIKAGDELMIWGVVIVNIRKLF